MPTTIVRPNTPPAFHTSNLHVGPVAGGVPQSIRFDLIPKYGRFHDAIEVGTPTEFRIFYGYVEADSSIGHGLLGHAIPNPDQLEALSNEETVSLPCTLAPTSDLQKPDGAQPGDWFFGITGSVQVELTIKDAQSNYPIKVEHSLTVPSATVQYLNVRRSHK